MAREQTDCRNSCLPSVGIPWAEDEYPARDFCIHSDQKCHVRVNFFVKLGQLMVQLIEFELCK